MKKKMTDNWGLKIIAFLFSFILWLAVINVDDPVASETFKNIPVQFINTELLTDGGLTYEILEESDIIESVTVYGPRTLVESLNSSSIVATADFSDITVTNTVAINITIDSRNSSKVTNIRSSLDSVKLNVEESKSVQLVINATTSGETADGYVVGGIGLDQNRVVVSGPETIVSQIHSAKVNVDVTDANSDVATYGTVKLYDINGDEINNSILIKSVDTVHVDVNVLPVKNVPITFEQSGTPETGYTVVEDDISCNIDTVLIAGETDQLSEFNEIVIAPEDLDVTGLTETAEIKVNLKDYLPKGIIFADRNYDGTATIIIPIDAVVTEVVELLGTNIAITNIPEGFTAEILHLQEYYEFDITGAESNVREAMTADLLCTVDMDVLLEERGASQWRDGTYDIRLEAGLPNGVTMTNIEVSLVVTKIEE